MKKTSLFFLSAMLGLTSCTQDLLDNNGTGRDGDVRTVTVNLSAPDDIRTRAAEQKNSAKGGITNADFNNEELRYTLQVFTKTGGVWQYGQIKTKTATSGSTTETFDLTIGEEYKIVGWADFVTSGQTTTGLSYSNSNMYAIVNTNHNINDEYQDGYFGSQDFTAGEGNVDLTLKRPLAKVRVVKINGSDGIDDNSEVTVSYKGGTNYRSLNAFTGELTADATQKQQTYTAKVAQYGPDDAIETGGRTLFVDYMFANTVEDKIDFDLKWKQGGKEQTAVLKEIPVKRNRLTTIYLQNTDTGVAQIINITIDEDFDDDEKTLWYGEETLADMSNLFAMSSEGGSFNISGDEKAEDAEIVNVACDQDGNPVEGEAWFEVTKGGDDEAKYKVTWQANTTGKPRFGTVTFKYPHYTKVYKVSQAANLAEAVEIDMTGLSTSADLSTAINDKLKDQFEVLMDGSTVNEAYKYVEKLKLKGSTTDAALNNILQLVRNNASMGKIGYGALKELDMSELTGVTELRESILYGAHGGQNTNLLTKVTLPAGIKKIGRTAFAFQTGLKELVIPEGVTEIGGNAFKNLETVIYKGYPVVLKTTYMAEGNKTEELHAFNAIKTLVVSAAVKAAMENPNAETFGAIEGFEPTIVDGNYEPYSWNADANKRGEKTENGVVTSYETYSLPTLTTTE